MHTQNTWRQVTTQQTNTHKAVEKKSKRVLRHFISMSLLVFCLRVLVLLQTNQKRFLKKPKERQQTHCET